MDEPQALDAHAPRLRLFVTAGLEAGGAVTLGGNQTHYLRNVMRSTAGDRVALFNGSDGEWRARIERLGRGEADLAVEAQLRGQTPEPDLWLAFAAIKRAPIDLIAEKATELGAARLLPVYTSRTQAARVNTGRLAAIATAAAKQCGRLSVPEIVEPQALDKLLGGWPGDDRPLLVCDESGRAPPLAEILAGLDAQRWGVLVGPEGGFAEAELDAMDRLAFARRVGLGPRILRAETAAVAALSVLQALRGDWRPEARALPGQIESF